MASAMPPNASIWTDVTPLPRRDRHAPAELPIPLTPLFGREFDIANLAGMLRLQGVRLVTVSGPGGVGKTRLALAVSWKISSNFADGVAFVSLGAVLDSRLVASTISAGLGLRERTDQRSLERLYAHLKDRDLLLVLDNFEQVLAAAPVVTDLLQACPSLKVLITSRSRLRVSGEHEYVVAPLALPDLNCLPRPDKMARTAAVQLFAERAQAAATGFAITNENASTVAEICHRLDGLPLALELAAAWCKMLPPEALLRRLKNRLQMLTGGPRDAPSRLQTMREAIAWSYDLLDESEQTLFRCLAVFTGGFTLDAAEAVTEGGGVSEGEAGTGVSNPPSNAPCEPSPPLPPRSSVLELVASLIDKSLLRPVVPGGALEVVSSLVPKHQSSATSPRFGMMETVREYGLERLVAHGEEPMARERHARWCINLAEQALEFPTVEVRPDVLDLLDAELGNVRAALVWLEQTGNAGSLARLAGALAPYWLLHSHRIEGRHWIERGLEMAGHHGAPAALRAKALLGLALLARTQHDSTRAVDAAESALALYRELDDTRGTAVALNLLGTLARGRADYDQAAKLLSESLVLFRELGEPLWISLAYCNLGILAHWQGNGNLAVALLNEALAGYHDQADPWGIGVALSDLALVTGDQGNHVQAAAMYADSLARLRQLGSKETLVDLLARIATLAVARGRPRQTAQLLGAAEAIAQALGYTTELPERVRYEQAAADAHHALGNTAFARAWNSGRELDLNRAVALAEEVTARIAGDVSSPRPRGTESSNSGQGTNESIARPLTPRERDVLRLIMEGYSDRDIALALFISPKTVAKHVASILTKLGVGTRTAAAIRAVRDGLL